MNLTNGLLLINIVLISVDLYLAIKEAWRRHKQRKEKDWWNSL